MIPNAMKNASQPWQVLELVSHYLDPETLAAASCVSKSWSISLSSDHLWRPICSAAFPSLASLHSAAAVPYRTLYSLGRAAEARRLKTPAKPHLSMKDLVFAVDIQNGRGCVATVVNSGGELKPDKGGIFRFGMGVEGDKMVAVDDVGSLKVTWNVVLQGFKGVFGMMECSGKGSALDGWFSKELPLPDCCSGGGGSGMVADLRVGMTERGGEVVVENICVGILSVVSWRYVCVDAALRYLQHFLSLSN